jgi:AcrR family transcriptional regulator
MRDYSFPHSPSKRRLLEEAEKLFADRGFDVVSIRDITKAAEANSAAVNYHFGSKDGLIAVVVSRYLVPINEKRLTELNSLEKQYGSQPVPIESLLEAMVRPMAGVVRKSELSERLFYKLLGRIFSLQHEGFPAVVEQQVKLLANRFRRALGKHFPNVSEEELAWKIQFVVGAMIHTLIHQEWMNRMTDGASGAPSVEVTLERFVRFAAAGLREGEPESDPNSQGAQVLFDF